MKLRQKLFIVLILFFLGPILWGDQFEKQFSEQESYADEETRELADLFHYLFAQYEFGYTLLEEKPMSFCFLPTGAPHISTQDHVFKFYRRGQRSYSKGVSLLQEMLATKKINRNYLFITHYENNIPIFMLLINKKLFIEEFNNHIELFRRYYSYDVNVDSLILGLENKTILFNKLFNQHLLLGVMLGYGKHNAELFQRRAELFSSIFKIPFLIEKKPNQKFPSIAEELRYLKANLKPVISTNHFLSVVTGVNFVGDISHSDTLLLKRKYLAAHKKVNAIFTSENWFEIILNLLSE